MTNKTCPEYCFLLERLLSADLDAVETIEAVDHLAHCATCASYWQKLQNDDRLLTEFSRTMKTNVSRIEKGVIRSLHLETAKNSHVISFWRWIMFTNWGRVTAALILILASLLIYSLRDQPGPVFTAWAEVAANIENADTFQYWERDLVSGHNKKTIIGGNLGYYREIYRDDRLLLREYWDAKTNSIIFFDDEEKKYGYLFLSQDQLEEAKELDPQNLLTRVMKFKHYDLGQKTVGGRRAAGIEVRDPSFEIAKWDRTEAELWVDIETELPIRFEMIGEAGHGRIRRHLVLEDFEWNLNKTLNDYVTGIPRDYELIMNLPEIVGDEQHTIEALRIYSRLTKGRFPSTLAMETALEEVKSNFRQGESRFRDLEDAWNIYSAGKFFQQLLRDGKEPVYFGNLVRSGEADRVLLRWSVGPDRFRVIMGDLSIKELNSSELLKAEY